MQRQDRSRTGTARSGRVFAFTLMVGFIFVALIGAWKDVALLVRGGQIMAVVAFLAGVLVPRRLEPVRRGWMAFGEAIGRFTTPVMMAIVYYLVLTPTGLIRRAVSRRPGPAASYWEQRPP
ncbi:MAG TPA: SxtJ family membrane protein, partial [Gemmatimonadaceae bacterium]|nr:SxtJ family membrane protein [Gemmatimonadaceae bacterium]